MSLGTIGIWRLRHRGPDGVEEIEALGYGTLWLGASPSVEDARPYLERTRTMTVATGILNVWQHRPADVGAAFAELEREFPGRFLLGIGIGHPEATSDYTRPLATMRTFFDGLDAVPGNRRIAAALGPKMLDLAAEQYAAGYLARRNYVANLERLGFTGDDLRDGGSDRLIDAVIPHGSPADIAEAVRAHRDAGADHVCLQPLGPDPAADYRALAAELIP